MQRGQQLSVSARLASTECHRLSCKETLSDLQQSYNTACSLESPMALPSITASTTFAGDRNQGLQVGHNSGNIESHFHVPADRPETPPQPSCFVPFRRDPDFVGRTTLLDQIDKRCSVPASRVALVGLGGVG